MLQNSQRTLGTFMLVECNPRQNHLLAPQLAFFCGKF